MDKKQTTEDEEEPYTMRGDAKQLTRGIANVGEGIVKETLDKSVDAAKEVALKGINDTIDSVIPELADLDDDKLKQELYKKVKKLSIVMKELADDEEVQKLITETGDAFDKLSGQLMDAVEEPVVEIVDKSLDLASKIATNTGKTFAKTGVDVVMSVLGEIPGVGGIADLGISGMVAFNGLAKNIKIASENITQIATISNKLVGDVLEPVEDSLDMLDNLQNRANNMYTKIDSRLEKLNDEYMKLPDTRISQEEPLKIPVKRIRKEQPFQPLQKDIIQPLPEIKPGAVPVKQAKPEPVSVPVVPAVKPEPVPVVPAIKPKEAKPGPVPLSVVPAVKPEPVSVPVVPAIKPKEAKQEPKQVVKPEPVPVIKTKEVKPEPKPVVPVVKPEPVPVIKTKEVKPEPKPVVPVVKPLPMPAIKPKEVKPEPKPVVPAVKPEPVPVIKIKEVKPLPVVQDIKPKEAKQETLPVLQAKPQPKPVVPAVKPKEAKPITSNYGKNTLKKKKQKKRKNKTQKKRRRR